MCDVALGIFAYEMEGLIFFIKFEAITSIFMKRSVFLFEGDRLIGAPSFNLYVN